MKNLTGVCRYCGQRRLVRVGEDKDYTQQQLDAIATRECDCDTAARARIREDSAQTIRDHIEDLKIKDEWIKETILQGVERIADMSIYQVQITDGSGVVYKLTDSSKSGPKLTVKETKTTITSIGGSEEAKTGVWRDE